MTVRLVVTILGGVATLVAGEVVRENLDVLIRNPSVAGLTGGPVLRGAVNFGVVSSRVSLVLKLTATGVRGTAGPSLVQLEK